MKIEFSKLIISWELVVVTAISFGGLFLAGLAILHDFSGALPWITAMIAPSWGAFGVSKTFFNEKAKAENLIKIPAFIERENKNKDIDCNSKG